ncbi:MAG: hypothetical protein JJE39_00030 [Vicinamibacteria bacterium]|nr:hypothetical protein [Vicinamibacteria bacterium]
MRIKGTSIASFLGFLEAEYGASRTREFTASLEPGLRKRCEGLVLASAFYPVEELDSLATLARDYFAADASFFERSGAYNAAFGLAGVHQVLLARPTPLDFLRAAERAWRQFVDEGGVDVNLVGEGKVRLRFEAVPGSEVRCARQTGFLTRSLELAGAQKLSVSKATCTLKGDPFCEWNVIWDAEASPKPQSYTTAIRRPSSLQ